MKMSLLILIFVCRNLAADSEPQLRSYEYLASNPWTDHVQHFLKLMQIEKIHSFLEFGVGEGTKFYLDNCDTVTSVELLDKIKAESGNEIYYNKCIALYKSYSNWHPILYKTGPALDLAVSIAHMQQIDPLTVAPECGVELKRICDQIFQLKTYDVAFVDPGLIVRGSLVQELFNRVDIIVAHDVNFHPTIYGWAWIDTPSNYEKIHFTEGSGTAFWIKKDRIDLIQKLKQYPHQSNFSFSEVFME